MRIVPLEPPRGTRENWPHTLRVGGPVFWESEATGVRLLKDKDGSGYHPVADTERPEEDVAQRCICVARALLACGKYVDGITAAGDEPSAPTAYYLDQTLRR